LTDIFVDRALTRAAELDNHFKQTGKVARRYHGKKLYFYNCTTYRLSSAMQRNIWNAASSEDYMITTSVTGEPIIATMELDNSNAAAAPFRPKKIGITAYQLWQVQKLRRDIRKEYLDHWEAMVSETGTGRPVDAIICPASSYAATPHGKNRSESAFWNEGL